MTPVVKMENPELLAVKEKNQVLKSAKVNLEKLFTQGKDLQANLDHAARKDEKQRGKYDECKAAMTAMEEFIDDLREKILVVDSLEPGDNIESLVAEMTQMAGRAMAHKEGFLAFKKRLSADKQ